MEEISYSEKENESKKKYLNKEKRLIGKYTFFYIL